MSEAAEEVFGTWRAIGPAPSKGDGSRVYLRCVRCKARTEVRKRHLFRGWYRPCIRCAQTTPPTKPHPRRTA